jgi:hypothetical protein
MPQENARGAQGGNFVAGLFPAMHTIGKTRRKKRRGLHPRQPRLGCSPGISTAIHLPKGSDRSGLASNVLYARTKLHRRMLHFLAARTESNSSDHRC